MHTSTLREELSELQKIKGEPCISIILPRNKPSPKERKLYSIKLKVAVNKARKIIAQKYDERDARNINKELDKLLGQKDFGHEAKGVGLFISKGLYKQIYFPFEVEEKIAAGNRFEIKNIINYINNLLEYFLLVLSKKHIRLFKGFDNKLSEVKDKNFPITFIDQHEYTRSHNARSIRAAGMVTSSFKSVEDDKSIMEEKRIKFLLKDTDNALSKYLEKRPLIVAGSEQSLNYFVSGSNHKKNIINTVKGNYDYYNEAKLEELIHSEIEKYLLALQDNMIKSFEEKISERKAVWGITNVWQAALKNIIETLLIEKDFNSEAYLSDNGSNIYTNENEKFNLKKINDAEEEIVRMVSDKNGKIVFVEKGRLNMYDKIGAILRCEMV